MNDAQQHGSQLAIQNTDWLAELLRYVVQIGGASVESSACRAMKAQTLLYTALGEAARYEGLNIEFVAGKTPILILLVHEFSS